MKNLGTYYGSTLLQEEASNKNKIELEYYKTKRRSLMLTSRKTFYGIAVVKKEYIEDKVKLEKSIIKEITTSERKIVNMIEKLKKYKVTPVGLEDVLTDLKKQAVI